MIIEFISSSCLQQLWSLLLHEKDFSVVSFPPEFMNESSNRKNSCSFYLFLLVSINLCQYCGYLVYMGGRLVLLRFSGDKALWHPAILSYSWTPGSFRHLMFGLLSPRIHCFCRVSQILSLEHGIGCPCAHCSGLLCQSFLDDISINFRTLAFYLM